MIATKGLLTCWVVCHTEQQLGRVQSERKRQGTQLQEANLQLNKAKQLLQESTQSLKASQKAAEYVTLSRHQAVSFGETAYATVKNHYFRHNALCCSSGTYIWCKSVVAALYILSVCKCILCCQCAAFA